MRYFIHIIINLNHRYNLSLAHARIEIGLRWLMVQMWFHRIAGIKNVNKSYALKLQKYIDDLLELRKHY